MTQGGEARVPDDQAIGAADAIACESARIARRRKGTGTDDHPALPGKHWALALSGGGIRSATFALGVLQGLASHALVGPLKPGQQTATVRQPWLRYFDYLSTVSGGGYIGAFFGSLFVPGRLTAPVSADPSKEAAENAYRALQNDPPSRPRRTSYEAGSTPGEMALAWLRNNGRYLAPTGSGDMFYAGAIHVRNWVSLHVVIGSLLLAVFALIGTLRQGVADFCAAAAAMESDLLPDTVAGGLQFWPSPLFIAPAIMLVPLFIIGFAYWMAHPDRGRDATSKSNPFSLAAVTAYGVAFVAVVVFAYSSFDPWARALIAAIGALCFLSALQHAASARGRTVDEDRNAITRKFVAFSRWTVALLLLALLDSLGQTAYLWLVRYEAILTVPSLATVFGAIIWLIRKSARLFDKHAAPARVLAKLPLSTIVGALAGAMFVILAIFWQLIVQVVMWQAREPSAAAIGEPAAWGSALGLAVVSGFLAIVMGQFAGFINLSTLQRFYGARITRAYLGSSNGLRFKNDAEAKRWASAADTHPDDDLTHSKYYAPQSLAPVHLINVTVNQTTDDGDQLVQRDRKGRHMAIGPTGFTIDDDFYAFADSPRGPENEQPLSIGQWVGTSGAAFTTGLGRQTSLGTSLALGLANVRLGVWWSTGLGLDHSRGFERFSSWAFKSQTYLGYECLAQFHGLYRPWQYLSDGGHFENTAVYPLLRRDRNINVIVVCDDGADPKYQFEDVANLIRLARIDHRIEIEVEEGVFADQVLNKVFARPEDFRAEARAGKRDKCALFLRAVGYNEKEEQDYRCAIIVLKPTLIDDAPEDVLQYGVENKDFPQQPTADQFFDEAQWESYRRLGRAIAHRVFGETRCGPALVNYLAANRYIS